MGLEKKHIQESYSRMSDADLLALATSDAKDLTPEAMEVLREEISKRKIEEGVNAAIDIQTRKISEEEFTYYVDLIRNLPCPVCSANNIKLNGALYAEAISVILFTNLSVRLKIACPTCLDNTVRKARTKSQLLGWWGIPWGLIRTPKAININNRSLSQNHLNTATDILRSYVWKKIGEIEMHKNSKDELMKIATYTD